MPSMMWVIFQHIWICYIKLNKNSKKKTTENNIHTHTHTHTLERKTDNVFVPLHLTNSEFLNIDSPGNQQCEINSLVFIYFLVLHSKVCEIDIFIQIRKTFTNVHTQIGIRKTRNWFRCETFYYLFEFKVFRHEERGRHNFFNKRAAHFVDPNWSRLGETKNRLPSSRLESQLPRSEFKSQLTAFFSNFKILSSSLPGMTSFTSPVSFPIWGFYCHISDCHIHPARAGTPAFNVYT